MSETSDKAQMVRRMLAAGRELSEEQRSSLLRLHARFEQLWAQREASDQTAASQEREPSRARPQERR
jgi:hypothetical protein